MARTQERIAGPGHDYLHRAVGPLAQRVLDCVLDHPGTTDRVFCLERQQSIRLVAAAAVTHHGRSMHGQTPQFAGLRTRPYKTETAWEVILPVASLSGGADGDNRLGLECTPQPSCMVVGQRIKTN